jgi:hypothetical protein
LAAFSNMPGTSGLIDELLENNGGENNQGNSKRRNRIAYEIEVPSWVRGV